MSIAPNHRDQLYASGLTDPIIEARGYKTINSPKELAALGFSKTQSTLTPCLLIPQHGVGGIVNRHQIRPDNPRDDAKGRARKYEFPWNSANTLDIPPSCFPYIEKPDVRLWLTEGSKKADALALRGECAISLPGVWGWVTRRIGSIKGMTLVDWKSVMLNKREVYLGFDSDAMQKKEVYLALKQLSEFLKNQGADVRIIYLPHVDGGKTGVDDYLAANHTIDDLLALSSDKLKPLDEPASTIPDDGRPTITHDPVDLTTSIDGVIDAIMSANDAVFTRDTQVVTVQTSKRKTRFGLKEDGERLRIAPAEDQFLVELATQAAHHLIPSYFKGGKQYFRPGSCPAKIITGLQARPYHRFHILTGVIETPTPRPDGSIINTPGYDAATGLYYQPSKDYPDIGTPSLDDAKKALETLREPFADFPFSEGCHESAALAAVLSIISRHLVRTVPLFAITSNTRGSGKGLIANTIGTIATGREPSKSAAPRDDEETRKLLLTVGLDGDRTTVFDNVAGVFGTASLERVLTEPFLRDRILGQSKAAEVELQTVFFLTGNNVKYRGDTSRRVVPITLSPQCENPEERSGFQHANLLEWVQDNQTRLFAAALAILRAYMIAGQPRQNLTPYGSFEQWSDLVRSALVWVGMDDPCSGRQAIEAEADSGFEQLQTLIYAWREAYPNGEKLQLKDIVAAVKKDDAQDAAIVGLGEALTAFDLKASGKVADINNARLSQKMPLNNGASRIVDGWRLRSEKAKNGGTKYFWAEKIGDGQDNPDFYEECDEIL